MSVWAILFDTRSIQRYIFSGSKLRTNIGASYIVSNVFQRVLVDDILKRRYGEVDERWINSVVDFSSEPEKSCQVAYIGGGNALILFREADQGECESIVYEFTKKLLYKYPGLQTGVAIGKLDFSTEAAFHETNQRLYNQLKQNQSTVFPQVNVPYTGITHICDVNGEAANAYWYEEGASGRYVSRETWAKNDAEREAQRKLEDEFTNVLGGKFNFPRKLENMGQTPGENYIAAVHIDGNNMGLKFEILNLTERIELSKKVEKKVHRAFASLLGEIVGEYKDYASSLQLAEEAGLTCVPIRPIILGGDDITFLCAAKAALSYTVRFMKAMMDKKNEDDISIDCCAGIAIQRTSYPFFRLYELAEQACGEAKKEAHKCIGSSWLDFVLLHGEQAPTLAEIRTAEYSGAWIRNLHFGPYEVAGDSTSERNISHLMECVYKLNQDVRKRKLARNKLKEMRYQLQMGEHDIYAFLEQLRHTGKNMPPVSGWQAYQESLWAMRGEQRCTPYLDAVEMMDYCLTDSWG